MGCHSGGGWEGRWLSQTHFWGPSLPLGLIGAKMPHSEPPSWDLAEERGREEFNPLVLSFDEGKTHMGQASGNRCW